MIKLKLTLLSIFLLHGLMAQTFTIVKSIPCGDSINITGLGYPSWNPPKIIQRPKLGHAILIGDKSFENTMKYTAPPCLIGSDTIMVLCAKATQITCDTGIYIFDISCTSSTPDFTTHEVDCMDSIYINNLNAFWQPQIITNPLHGFAKIILEPTDGAGVLYIPNKGYQGQDYVKVSIGGKAPKLYVFNVYCDIKVNTNIVPNLEYLLYPNPASEFLALNFPHESLFTDCVNVHGLNIPLAHHQNDDQWIFDIKNLNPGMYYLEMNHQGKRFIFKWMKQ
ncbi:MAG: T9SS type A sorting domain-containing protein [Saprospiraceae bacterium]|nr:T9SS type A sorting domain-containing protein [Candidatus Defluviibacterium haderslevense]